MCSVPEDADTDARPDERADVESRHAFQQVQEDRLQWEMSRVPFKYKDRLSTDRGFNRLSKTVVTFRIGIPYTCETAYLYWTVSVVDIQNSHIETPIVKKTTFPIQKAT